MTDNAMREATRRLFGGPKNPYPKKAEQAEPDDIMREFTRRVFGEAQNED